MVVPDQIVPRFGGWQSDSPGMERNRMASQELSAWTPYRGYRDSLFDLSSGLLDLIPRPRLAILLKRENQEAEAIEQLLNLVLCTASVPTCHSSTRLAIASPRASRAPRWMREPTDLARRHVLRRVLDLVQERVRVLQKADVLERVPRIARIALRVGRIRARAAHRRLAFRSRHCRG